MKTSRMSGPNASTEISINLPKKSPSLSTMRSWGRCLGPTSAFAYLRDPDLMTIQPIEPHVGKFSLVPVKNSTFNQKRRILDATLEEIEKELENIGILFEEITPQAPIKDDFEEDNVKYPVPITQIQLLESVFEWLRTSTFNMLWAQDVLEDKDLEDSSDSVHAMLHESRHNIKLLGAIHKQLMKKFNDYFQLSQIAEQDISVLGQTAVTGRVKADSSTPNLSRAVSLEMGEILHRESPKTVAVYEAKLSNLNSVLQGQAALIKKLTESLKNKLLVEPEQKPEQKGKKGEKFKKRRPGDPGDPGDSGGGSNESMEGSSLHRLRRKGNNKFDQASNEIAEKEIQNLLKQLRACQTNAFRLSEQNKFLTDSSKELNIENSRKDKIIRDLKAKVLQSELADKRKIEKPLVVMPRSWPPREQPPPISPTPSSSRTVVVYMEGHDVDEAAIHHVTAPRTQLTPTLPESKRKRNVKDGMKEGDKVAPQNLKYVDEQIFVEPVRGVPDASKDMSKMKGTTEAISPTVVKNEDRSTPRPGSGLLTKQEPEVVPSVSAPADSKKPAADKADKLISVEKSVFVQSVQIKMPAKVPDDSNVIEPVTRIISSEIQHDKRLEMIAPAEDLTKSAAPRSSKKVESGKEIPVALMASLTNLGESDQQTAPVASRSLMDFQPGKEALQSAAPFEDLVKAGTDRRVKSAAPRNSQDIEHDGGTLELETMSDFEESESEVMVKLVGSRSSKDFKSRKMARTSLTSKKMLKAISSDAKESTVLSGSVEVGVDETGKLVPSDAKEGSVEVGLDQMGKRVLPEAFVEVESGTADAVTKSKDFVKSVPEKSAVLKDITTDILPPSVTEVLVKEEHGGFEVGDVDAMQGIATVSEKHSASKLKKKFPADKRMPEPSIELETVDIGEGIKEILASEEQSLALQVDEERKEIIRAKMEDKPAGVIRQFEMLFEDVKGGQHEVKHPAKTLLLDLSDGHGHFGRGATRPVSADVTDLTTRGQRLSHGKLYHEPLTQDILSRPRIDLPLEGITGKQVLQKISEMQGRKSGLEPDRLFHRLDRGVPVEEEEEEPTVVSHREDHLTLQGISLPVKPSLLHGRAHTATVLRGSLDREFDRRYETDEQQQQQLSRRGLRGMPQTSHPFEQFQDDLQLRSSGISSARPQDKNLWLQAPFWSPHAVASALPAGHVTMPVDEGPLGSLRVIGSTAVPSTMVDAKRAISTEDLPPSVSAKNQETISSILRSYHVDLNDPVTFEQQLEYVRMSGSLNGLKEAIELLSPYIELLSENSVIEEKNILIDAMHTLQKRYAELVTQGLQTGFGPQPMETPQVLPKRLVTFVSDRQRDINQSCFRRTLLNQRHATGLVHLRPILGHEDDLVQPQKLCGRNSNLPQPRDKKFFPSYKAYVQCRQNLRRIPLLENRRSAAVDLTIKKLLKTIDKLVKCRQTEREI